MKINKKGPEIVVVLGILLITVYTVFKLLSKDVNSISSWKEKRDKGELVLTSPLFTVDKIHKSMMGPSSVHQFVIDPTDSSLLWLTAYQVDVKNLERIDVSGEEFICHNNLDYTKVGRNSRWQGLSEAVSQYPRLITLTQGQTELKFPEGFGFPVFSNETLIVRTQVLNLNLSDTSFDARHEVKLHYSSKSKKPLFERSIFVMLPFQEISDGIIDSNKTTCLPVNPNDHRYDNNDGGVSTGHWVVPVGKSVYSYEVTSMLNLNKPSVLHYAGSHTHPFARRLILKDLTADSVVLQIECDNFTNKKGLKKIAAYSSKTGILLSHLHEYELTVEINNTTSEPQDMMASMFLYFYDEELDNKLKQSGLSE